MFTHILRIISVTFVLVGAMLIFWGVYSGYYPITQLFHDEPHQLNTPQPALWKFLTAGGVLCASALYIDRFGERRIKTGEHSQTIND